MWGGPVVSSMLKGQDDPGGAVKTGGQGSSAEVGFGPAGGMVLKAFGGLHLLERDGARPGVVEMMFCLGPVLIEKVINPLVAFY